MFTIISTPAAALFFFGIADCENDAQRCEMSKLCIVCFYIPFFFFLIENTFNKKLKRNFSVVLARDIMSREYFSHSRCDASAFFMQQKTFFVEFKKKLL